MTWADGLVLAVRSLKRRAGRTSLTIIAVALGSGLLVALASIAQTADDRIVSQLGKGGPAAAITVSAAEPNPFDAGADTQTGGRTHAISDAGVAQLRALPNVVGVTPVLSMSVDVTPLAPLPSAAPVRISRFTHTQRLPQMFLDHVVGIRSADVGDLPITVLAGRMPAASSTTEVAVTQAYLDRLQVPAASAATALGTTLALTSAQDEASSGRLSVVPRTTRAVIVGVISQQITTAAIVAPIAAVEADRAWALGGAATSGHPLPTSQYTAALVIAATLDDVHGVRNGITALGYANSAPEQLVDSVEKYLHVVDIVLGAIGFTALGIAALGIADSLAAAVRERRRQIAALKAIGAGDLDIARWFIFEASIIGVIGGVAGSVLGFAIAFATGVAVNGYLVGEGITGVDLGGVPLAILAVGVLGSVLVSVVAGVVPAIRAARLGAYAALGGE